MKKIQYLLPLFFIFTYCKHIEDAPNIVKIDSTISVQKFKVDSSQKKQDVIITKGDVIVAKIKASTKTSTLLPSSSSLPETGKIAKVKGKVIQDSSDYDSVRAILIQKDKDADSCSKIVVQLKKSILSDRVLRDTLESLLMKKSLILNDSIVNINKQHKKDLRKAQWKGIKKGVVGTLFIVVVVFIANQLR